MPFEDAHFDRALSVHTVYFWRDPTFVSARNSPRPSPEGSPCPRISQRRRPQSNALPREVYAFYEERDISAMLVAAAFASIKCSRIGECSLAGDSIHPCRASWLKGCRQLTVR